MPVNREYLQALLPHITDELIVTTPGRLAAELCQMNDRDGNLYQVDMFQASAFAFGLALALPRRRVIALDGDGSVLMALTLLPALANKNLSNLVVIVVDNELYEMSSIDKIATFTKGGADLAGIAREAGLKNSREVRTVSDFDKAVTEAFRGKGTGYIVAKAQRPPAGSKPVGLPPLDMMEYKYRFIRYIEKTEKIQVIVPSKRMVT